MTLSILLLIAGLVLLVGGADFLVRGVSALAEAAGVPALVVGMTVVAFGTSTPELVVNLFAAFHGQTELSFGSIVGSTTINIGFVLAVTALIRPLDVEQTVITREIPMMILGVAAMVVMASDRAVDGATKNLLTRGDGIILLLLFCVFLYYTTRTALKYRTQDALVAEIAESPAKHISTQMASLLTIGGLIGVGVGGRLCVGSAVKLAEAMHISQAIIGMTVVSLGTTLPELTTGILAARRGQSDIAVGNIVGSCIFNSLLIGGLVSVIHPIPIPQGGVNDLLVVLGFSIAPLPIAMRGPRKITRGEGALLLALYLTFAIYRTVTSAGAGD